MTRVTFDQFSTQLVREHKTRPEHTERALLARETEDLERWVNGKPIRGVSRDEMARANSGLQFNPPPRQEQLKEMNGG